MSIHFHAASLGYQPYRSNELNVESFRQLFIDLPDVIAKIPEFERKNLFFALAQTKQPRRKKRDDEDLKDWQEWTDKNWLRQEVFAIDIDSEKVKGKDSNGKTIVLEVKELNLAKIELYSDIVAKHLKTEAHHLTIVCSGNGLHFYAYLDKPITSWRYFQTNKIYYETLARNIEQDLKARGLNGQVDDSIFDHARIMRLPLTQNVKDGKIKACTVVQTSFTPIPISFNTLLDLPTVLEKESITQDELKTMKRGLDKEGILTLCNFLKWTKESAHLVKEPEGYAALQILTHLGDNLETAREYYQSWTGSGSLQRADAEAKMEHARTASPPRLCDSFASLRPDLCAGCTVRCRTPLQLKRPEFIASESMGFYTTIIVDPATGETKRGKPAYNDLLKAYIRDTNYIYQPAARQIWAWSDTHYQDMPEAYVKNYAEEKLNPQPNEAQRSEFLSKVKANRLKNSEECSYFFFDDILGKINLKNGVLDTATRTLSPHSPQYGFRYCLPYEYDPTARAPVFEQYLKDVTLHREEYELVLRDILGALLVPGYEPFGAAFWWLQGEGRNGKSTFLDICKWLVGTPSTAYFKARDFTSDASRFRLAELDGKLLCILEEVGEKTFPRNLMAMLKDLSAGGTILVERKHAAPFHMQNFAKMVFTANGEPILEDPSAAVRERFIMVPFDLNLRDPNCPVKIIPEIKTLLKAELPGIFNLALEARDNLLKRGRAFHPQGSRDMYHEMVLNSNSFELWFDECAEVTGNADDQVYFKDAHASYLKLIENENPMSSKTFSKQLRQKLRIKTQLKSGRINGGPSDKLVPGIKLRAPGIPIEPHGF